MIAILGCGPAGLLAAHACAIADEQFAIFSRKRRTILPGAMYLHKPIDLLTDEEPDGYVEFIKRGDRAGYAEKVYGDRSAPCSWDLFAEGRVPAWSLADAYAKLWTVYGDSIIDVNITQDFIARVKLASDMVISTVPVGVLCHNPYHRHDGANVYVLRGSSYAPQENTIVYNGYSHNFWTRSSRLFGDEFVEASRPFPGAGLGNKPIKTNCDCHPTIVRAGRYGEWRKGVLTHHAFWKVQQRLARRSHAL